MLSKTLNEKMVKGNVGMIVLWMTIFLLTMKVSTIDGFMEVGVNDYSARMRNVMRKQYPSSSSSSLSSRSQPCWMTQSNDDNVGAVVVVDGESMGKRMMDRRRMGLWTASAVSSVLWLPPSASHAVVAAAAVTTTTSSTSDYSWRLKNGVEFPRLALNTVGLSVEDTTRAVEWAVQEGIHHVDFHPGKERDGVAQYLSQQGGRQQQQQQQHDSSVLFLTTKIRKAPPGTTPEQAAMNTRQQIEDDLKALNVNQVDMIMLRDSPDAAVIQAQWKVLEQALANQQTRSLGVINFCQSAMDALLATATTLPDVHYYLWHVGMGPDAHGIRSYAQSKGIRTFAYGAVGEPGPNPDILNHPTLQQIASSRKKENITTEQVALQWLLQSGAAVSVRPTLDFALGQSTCSNINDKCYKGIQSRASLLSKNKNNLFTLTPKEIKQLNDLTSPDDNPTLFSSSGCPNAFAMPK